MALSRGKMMLEMALKRKCQDEGKNIGVFKKVNLCWSVLYVAVMLQVALR